MFKARKVSQEMTKAIRPEEVPKKISVKKSQQMHEKLLLTMCITWNEYIPSLKV